MRSIVVLLAIAWFASSPVFAQVGDPNPEMDAWREALQQYTADRELWRAEFEEATKPMSAGKKLLLGLAYVGDKAVTGFVNYYSSRAAIRSEMGRFDARFRSVESNILQATGSLAMGQASILAGQGNILSGQDNILSGQGNILSGQGNILTGQDNILSGQGNISEDILEGQGDILEGLGTLLDDRMPPCTTPFGPTGQEPCR